ncbi:MAG: hypothetical protein ABSH01_23295 [Terriglobia bacterium]
MKTRLHKNSDWATPTITSRYLEEAPLAFAGGRYHVDPKGGIARFGPKSFAPQRRHPTRIRAGFIGSAETIDKAAKWIEEAAKGVRGDEKHPEFPGFDEDRGFFSKVEYDGKWNEQITHTELESISQTRPARTRFERAVQLLEDKLRILAQKDQAPEYVVIAIPDSLRGKCRVVDYKDAKTGHVHRDLRRAIKAAAMKYRMPTQLIKQRTIEGLDEDHPSKIAWNFFTGLYFKAGGVPWGPVGLLPGSCYVGVSFYHSLGSEAPTMQTSTVQAFDENGDGLVLRGPDFEWDSNKNKTKSPHLKLEQAYLLMELVLKRYHEEMKQAPKRVVVHKTSKWWTEEKAGFEEYLRTRVDKYDLVSLHPQNSFRLITVNKYPPLRGTHAAVGDVDFLYTTGFISSLGQFHSMHVPSPILISDHLGYDTPRETLLKEILVLTKMNWNSARFGGLLPVTIRFSRLVGDILKEIPGDREPLPQLKFYM